MKINPRRYQWAWLSALACFILAGSAGALLRFGLLYGFPADLQYANVRHAHSHFMYFGWVTPALMALMAARLPELTQKSDLRWQRSFSWVIATVFILALMAYVAFLLYGYQLAPVGERRLPLSMITASLNVLAWYAFVVLYVKATWGVPRQHALRLWDAAIAFLVLSSFGAWGLALSRPLGLDSPFLSTIRLIAGVGGILVGLGLLLNLWALWPSVTAGPNRAWRVPLFFLGVKAAAIVATSLPWIALWAERMALRVSYMHWLLLGFVTLGLVAAAGDTWGKQYVAGRRWLTLAVLLLFISLIPLTRLWPEAWSGRWLLHFAAWVTPGPLMAAILMWAGSLSAWRSGRRPSAEPATRTAVGASSSQELI